MEDVYVLVSSAISNSVTLYLDEKYLSYLFNYRTSDRIFNHLFFKYLTKCSINWIKTENNDKYPPLIERYMQINEENVEFTLKYLAQIVKCFVKTSSSNISKNDLLIDHLFKYFELCFEFSLQSYEKDLGFLIKVLNKTLRIIDPISRTLSSYSNLEILSRHLGYLNKINLSKKFQFLAGFPKVEYLKLITNFIHTIIQTNSIRQLHFEVKEYINLSCLEFPITFSESTSFFNGNYDLILLLSLIKLFSTLLNYFSKKEDLDSCKMLIFQLKEKTLPYSQGLTHPLFSIIIHHDSIMLKVVLNLLISFDYLIDYINDPIISWIDPNFLLNQMMSHLSYDPYLIVDLLSNNYYFCEYMIRICKYNQRPIIKQISNNWPSILKPTISQTTNTIVKLYKNNNFPFDPKILVHNMHNLAQLL